MKKNLQKLFVLCLSIAISYTAQSQFNYWGGAAAGFEGIQNVATTTASSGNTTGGTWFMDSVSASSPWFLKNYYRTTSTSGQCAGQKADVRMPKIGTAPNFGCLATPFLGFGVNTVTFVEGRGARKVSVFYTTSDTTVSNYTAAGTIPSNWVFVDSSATSSTKCADKIITINNAAARRVIFVNLSASDEDIDSIRITSVNIITPVKFGGISASETNGLVKINWNAEAEVNTNSYVIERATSGDNFIAIGTVSLNKSKAYTWVDKTAAAGTNYYRIKAIDNNGSFMYSNAVKLTIGKSKSELSVYPNPVSDSRLNIQVSGIASGDYKVNIYAMNGALVYTTSLSSAGTSLAKTIDLPSAVRTGTYTLEITNGSFKSVKSILIK